jgi:hypothetical protein
MKNEFKVLSESEIIRRAEQERSKAVGEFFARLFNRRKNTNLSINPVPADFATSELVARKTTEKPEELAKAA